MKTQPIHRNLSTSFVNLGSLVLHLQNRKFVGRVRVELDSYESEIIFATSRMVYVRDCDMLTGLTRVGEQAFRETLKRSQEPLGLITVYQADPLLVQTGMFVDKTICESAKRQSSCTN